MPIIDGNRRIEVGQKVSFRGHGTPTDPRNNPHANRINCKLTALPDKPGEKRKSFVIERGGKTGAAVLADMEVVQEHFGLNISDALRISLHLTANAIRANKAHPEVA